MFATHEHKFTSGQTVLYLPKAMDGAAPRGSYVVLHCLPDDGIGFRYAVRSVVDSHERVVREDRLKPTGLV